MNFDNLPPPMGFLFITLGQAAVSAERNGLTQEQFMDFCRGMWETMELNGPEGFADILQNKMAKDIDDRMGRGSHDTIMKMARGKR